MGADASWHIFAHGEQQGPLSEGEVNEMIRSGVLDDSAKVVGPQHEDWTPIKEVMAFAPLFSGFGQQEESTLWVASIDGVEQAPETESSLSDHIRAGQVPETAYVRGPGTPEWTPIAEVMAFAPLFHGFGSGDEPVNEALAASPVGEDEPWLRLVGWQPAYTGLNLYYKAILLAILQILLMIASPLIIVFFAGLSMGSVEVARMLLRVLSIAMHLGWVGVAVLMLVGLIYYTRLPTETGARGLATGAMVLCSVALLVAIGTLVLSLLGPEPTLQTGNAKPPTVSATRILISGVAAATTALGLILLLASMIRVARYIGQDLVAQKALRTLILYCVIFGGQLAFSLFISPALSAKVSGGGLITLAFTVGMAILSFICLGMFISTVNGLRTALLVAS